MKTLLRIGPVHENTRNEIDRNFRLLSERREMIENVVDKIIDTYPNDFKKHIFGDLKEIRITNFDPDKIQIIEKISNNIGIKPTQLINLYLFHQSFEVGFPEL